MIFFEPFVILHDLKCWINIFIKQAYLPFLMLLKVLRTWKKYIKVHLEQKEMCPKNCDSFAINRELTMDKMQLIVI